MIHESIQEYNAKQNNYTAVCQKLSELIQQNLSESTSKIWHAHPVWFLDDNPTVGYSVEKPGVRLMFWSGRSFDEPKLVGTSTFKDASIFYTSVNDIDQQEVLRWLQKSESIQWDYKNIVKRKGQLLPLKGVDS